MIDYSAVKKLDPREQHFRIPGPIEGLSLFLRLLPGETAALSHSWRAVLYVHGATFPSALSIAYRFDGRSWRDSLCDAGFDVWGPDFCGFGHSDRYSQMDEPPADNAPLCVAEDAAKQLEAAVRFISHARQDFPHLSLLGLDAGWSFCKRAWAAPLRTKLMRVRADPREGRLPFRARWRGLFA